jgi:hypothetical protein
MGEALRNSMASSTCGRLEELSLLNSVSYKDDPGVQKPAQSDH